jgi:hypothetical protein
MVSQKLNNFLLYRMRFLLSYLLFAAAVALLLIVAGFYLPGGLSSAEIHSAIVSDNLNPAHLFSLHPEQLINLPYRLLQAASIAVFGFSAISIKLPSIILGFASALAILYLLNLWYKRNVAIVAAIVAVTSNLFLVATQAGQAGITYIFLTTFILIAASMIARRSAYAGVWVVAGFLLAGVSLYMPLNIYILLALVVTAIVHPHARHLLMRESSKPVVIGGFVLFCLVISPLIFGIVHDTSLIPTLLGLPSDWSKVGGNVSTLLHQYGNFYHPRSGTILTPIYGLGTVLLILLGIYRLLSAKYTTKSYIISFWLVLLIPLIFLNPNFVSITFIPTVLLIAYGIDYLIWSWYRLFPYNPYARIFGLLPLAVLIGGIALSNVDRYVYGFHYAHSVYSAFNFDLSVLSNKLSSLNHSDRVVLVVSKQNKPLYENFSHHQRYVERLVVTTDPTAAMLAPIVIVEQGLQAKFTDIPAEVIVSRAVSGGDRFYVYKNPHA